MVFALTEEARQAIALQRDEGLSQMFGKETPMALEYRYVSTYGTARGTSEFISAIGWIVVVLSGAGLVFILTSIRPTVSHDIISLVASSCGYYRGQIEHRAAHEFAVHVATQRGLAKRPPHRHPPRAQPVRPCGSVTAGVHG